MIDTMEAVALDITGTVPWWAWVALVTMMFWGLLVPAPGDD